MKRLGMLAAVAAGLALAAPVPHPAGAAPPKVKARRCSSMSGPHWFGMFQGIGQRGIFQDRMIYEAGCFATRADCRAWLYWLRSAHGAGEQAAGCHRRS